MILVWLFLTAAIRAGITPACDPAATGQRPGLQHNSPVPGSVSTLPDPDDDVGAIPALGLCRPGDDAIACWQCPKVTADVPPRPGPRVGHSRSPPGLLILLREWPLWSPSIMPAQPWQAFCSAC